MIRRRKWTIEEDEILVQAITAEPYNLRKCFLSIATKINRTPGSVKIRWYNHTRFTSMGRKTMLTIGKNSMYTGKNYKQNSRVEPEEIRNSSLWARILTILRLK